MAEIVVNDNNFEEEVLRSNIPVFVDFWAPWCVHCQAMDPIVERLAEEYKEKVKFCKLNVDEAPKTTGEYKIMSIPTSIIFKDGNLVEQIVGTLSESEFKKKIDAIIK
jgi:thioredoxin 1